MRIALQQSDVGGLDLELPPSADGAPRRVRLQSARGVAAEVAQGADGLSVRDMEVEEAVLEALRLVFGKVALAEDQGAILGRVRGTLARTGDETAVDLEAATVVATHLAVDTPTVHVHGKLRVEGFRLQVRGKEGRVEGDRVHVAGFALGVGSAKGTAVELQAQGLRLGWGGSGFWMQAEVLRSPSLRVAAGGVRIQGHGLEVSRFHLHGADVSVGEGRVEDLAVSAVFRTSDARGGKEPAGQAAASADGSRGERAPPFDWRLLDGVSGEVRVDVGVDLAVPVIGRRRATHRLRIPIQEGTLDYRRLESDLSALESSLLDFSFRDDRTLVVELGVPLLPTRGRGKPILLWDLENDDRRLANQRRVRLAVLPRFRLASKSSEPPPPADAPSPQASGATRARPRVALRRLDLTHLGVHLSHAEVPGPLSGAVQRFVLADFRLDGSLHHDGASTPREGRLEGGLNGLEVRLDGLGLGGTRRMDLQDLRLGRSSNVRMRFAGLRPASLELDGAGLSLSGLHLRPRA